MRLIGVNISKWDVRGLIYGKDTPIDIHVDILYFWGFMVASREEKGSCQP